MTPTPTSGAADLPEALINSAREIEALKRDCGVDPESAIAIQNGRYMAISSEIRALAAGQATAAPAQPAAQQPHRSGCTAGTDEACVQRGCGTNCPAVSPQADSVLEDAAQQPRLTVRLTAFPESNGKQNWTALLVRADKWDGLVGNCGGISLARGELWNRVAYGAECARFLIGERDTEPFILDYGDDIKTPEEWKGEVYGGRKPRGAARKQGANQ